MSTLNVSIADEANTGDIIRQNTQPWALPSLNPPDKGLPGNYIPSPSPDEDKTVIENDLNEYIPPTGDENLAIQIDSIEIEGSTILKPANYALILSNYAGKKLVFADMQELVAELTQLYVKKGYVNSRIYIPQQDLSTHVLHLKALEVIVEKLILDKKGHWYGKRAILPRVDATKNGILNVNDLERSIRIINKNPDVNVQARIQKGEKPGTSQILLIETDKFPVHLTPFMDNLGRRSIGHTRFGLSSEINNLTGFGDQVFSTGNISRHSSGFVNQYTIPIGPYGTQLGFDYAYSRSTPVSALDLLSKANVYTPSIRQVLIEKNNVSMTASLGFDIKELKTDLNDTLFRTDKLRVLRPSIYGFINDKWGRTFWNQEAGIGLDFLGATNGSEPRSSKTGSGSKFLRLNGTISRYQRLPFGTTGVLRASYQYSPDRLPSAEQFQAGGAYTVRGYPEANIIGDSGYTLNAEWYFPLRIFPKNAVIPFSKQPLNDAMQFVAFGDLGQIFVKNPVPGERRNPTLASYGAGLRVRLTQRLVLRVDLGVPLTNVGPNSDVKLHFNLQSTLF